jgi:hypothetical protein
VAQGVSPEFKSPPKKKGNEGKLSKLALIKNALYSPEERLSHF